MQIVIAQAIRLVASLLIGSEVFERILGTVERWAEKEISGAEKRKGVLAELEVIGLQLTESLARLGIELAVTFLKSRV